MSSVFTPSWDIYGNPIALCQCSKCDRQEHFKSRHHQNKNDLNKVEVKNSDALAKANSAGWVFYREGPICPVCERNRIEALKQQKEMEVAKEPTAAPQTRQPTREQKRMIVSALEEHYDTKNQRYLGGETDKTLSDRLADGVMPGWVSAVREDMFGPEGNEEIVDLSAEIKEWMEKTDKAIDAANKAFSDIVHTRGMVKTLQDRLNKIVTAIGPKAERL